MLGLAFDLVDPGDVEGGILGLGPDGLGGVFRDHAEFRKCVRGMRFDLEPDLEAGLGLPDRGHFQAGVAGDHQQLMAKGKVRPRYRVVPWLYSAFGGRSTDSANKTRQKPTDWRWAMSLWARPEVSSAKGGGMVRRAPPTANGLSIAIY
jgi:hypothetical protein